MLKTQYLNQKHVVSILIILLIAFAHLTSYAAVTPVTDRTPQVRDAIVAAVPGINTASDVTETHLAAITALDLRAAGISALKTGDFSGLTGLTNLNLYGNQLSSLPDSIFEGLTALTTLRLGGNTVNPLPITVSIENLDNGQFKVVVPTGAPFDIVLPLSAMNGSIASEAASITISKGSTESSALTVSRTASMTAAVTVDVGTLPSLPLNHYGYVLSKSDALPLEVIGEVTTTPVVPDPVVPDPVVPDPVVPDPVVPDPVVPDPVVPDPVVPDPVVPDPDPPTPTNTAPMFSDGDITVRIVAENTAAGVNIGSAVAATDVNNDTLTYMLTGTDAGSFSIDSSSGQLTTKAALDYEMKRVYSVSITVSDGNLTDTIRVIISIIDTADTPLVSMSLPVSQRTPQVRDAIVAAVPGVTSVGAVTDAHLAAITSLNLRSASISELKTGDFSGLTGLTSLNLYNNMLSSLPNGIFEGLTALTSLRLGGNLVDPMPLIVSLQQVDANQFHAVIPTGAPFNVVLPVSAMMVTIPKGSFTSAPFTVVDMATVNIDALPSLPANHFGYAFSKSTVCNRTPEVAEAIAAAVPSVTDCRNVSDIQLATITSLDLSGKGITALSSDDFAGMLSLTTLNLSNNILSSLPDGIFDDLPSLTTLDLSGNSVSPFPFTVSLQKVGENMLKTVVPTGAPFDIAMPVIIKTGNTLTGTINLTIPQGSRESQLGTVTRTAGTTTAVTADIGTLPSLPATHTGYALVKTNQQPLEVLSDINVAPVFTAGVSATRSIAENTAAGTNIGEPISATDADNDTLAYSLGGTDASAFAIDTKSGQLKTNAALDYETKNAYSVAITVSDEKLTDAISVTINVTDVDEKPETDDPVTTKDPTPTNNAPVFTDGESATRSIAENTGAGVDIGSAVSATDADNDTLKYSLDSTDAASFSIDSTTGQLRTSAALDYETKTSYSVTITVSDGSRTDTITVTVNITDIDEVPSNTAPVFAAGNSTTLTVAENTGSGVDIGTAVSATDADNDTLTYSLGGTDAASFSIDSTTGQLRTSAALDYETKTSYSVTITVSDGSLTDTISTTIAVTDVDETPSNTAPVFTDGDNTNRSVAENTGAGIDIGTVVSANDTDNDALTYSLGSIDAASFSIDSTTGQLRTEAALDYETKSSYSVTITVSDGSLTDTISVTIAVTDIDETPANTAPVFMDGDNTNRSVAENTGAGINIGTVVSANDTDNDALTYSLGSIDAASFSIDSTTGQLRTEAALDYETKSSYSVAITVSDGKGGTDTITVTVNITDIDEAPANSAPEFATGSTTLTVAERTGSGVNIGSTITATDADNDTLTYTLGGTDASAFSIDSSSGQLRTSAALDYESKSSYTVTFIASDGTLTDTITVTINVSDVNEAPAFSNGASTTRAIAENVPVDINIGSAVSATDPDNDTLTYTLGGTDAAAFSIDAATGQLQTKALLDYEKKDAYSVTITVSDGTLRDTITVAISVTDLNDDVRSNNPPAFKEGDSATRSIAENTDPGVNIGTPVAATDADNNTLAYFLSGDDASAFSIDDSSGQLLTSAALNYETKSSYTVTVTVSDGNLADTITVTISITDVNEAPVISDSADTTLSIAENTAAGVNIGGTLSATDPDDGDTLEYSLGGTDASSFSIDSTSGQLRTKTALDYEKKTSYSVTITVSDGRLTDTISVTIAVTDVDENRAPVFTDGESTTRSIAENTGSGVNIGSAVSATDADNDDLTHTLGGTDAGSFSINSTNGQLRTSAALDYESKTSYSVTINVSDGNGGTDTISVTINIIDVDENRAPVFTEGNSTTRSIAENTGSGVNIGSAVSATDADNDDLTHTLGGTDAGSFSISSTNGQLRTSAALDYESKTSYSVTINVSDGNGGTDTISVTINIIDVDENRAPVFTEGNSATRSITENTGSGVNIGSAVSATDADNDTLEYTLGGTDASSFSINSTNGQLRTNAALNYEKKTSYSVTINVSDGNGGTDTISVTINITDVDENRAPVFTEGNSATRSIAENTGSGVNIGGAVSATDADNDTLEYSLGGTDAGSFSIDSTSGQLRTSASLNYESKTSYSVTVSVSDGNGGNDSITVTINVTNVNEAPVFSDGSSTTRSVAENTAANTNIGNAVSATDVDSGDTLTYTLGGTDAGSFDIVRTSGQLRTSASLNYESKTSYSVTVSVSDGNGGNDSITVTINVTNVNEAPVFSDGSSTTRSVAENTAANTNIGNAVSATDVDSGDTLTYTLGGTDAGSFDIVRSSGQLKTDASLNYESKTSYSVTITVSDGNLTDTINVTISITDVNDAPVFLISNITRSIQIDGNTAAGANIGDPVSATDADNDTLTYTLGGTDASLLSIVGSSGQLQTTAAFISDTRSVYAVTVTANDGNGGSVSVNVGVTATRKIQQVTNSVPVFTDGSSTTRSVAENTNAGENIGTAVAATDDDNDPLTYTLGGDDAASFDIVSMTGQLQTKAALNYDTKNTYTVTITVSDGNGGTDTITVTINVTDVEDTLITERTSQVRNAIVAAVPGVSSADDVTETHLAAITKLELNSVGLTGLKDGDFNGLTGLTKLEIEHNQSLESLPSGIFDELTSLTELSLLDNDLSSLPSGVFNGLTGLTKLEIERNQSLESLPSGIFDELTSLTELSLLDNDLSSLPSGVFDELTSLTRLNLQDNSLRSLPSGIFDNLTQLETLNLNYNSLRSLPDDIFSNLTNLLYLYLDGNSLRSLPDDIFDGLTQLTSLDLSGNSITSFSSDVFDDLTALTRLDLQVNRFTSLPSGIFDSLTQLDTLDLEGSSRGGYLSSLPSGIFDNLTQLTRLDLGNNRLSSLPDGIFSNLTNLLYLYLDGNSLRSLPDGIFENLTRLVELDLKWNARNPLQSTVSLEKVGDAQFKAVVSTGAPFSIVLPISVTRGSISGGLTQATVSSEADNAEEGLTIIVPRGSRESAPIDVTRTTGTTEAVTVDIGTLPGLSTHFGYPAGTTEGGKRIVIGGLRPYNSGYTFVKSSGLPLEVIAAGAAAINKQINPNNVPVFTESSPSRSIEIDGDTAAGANIGDPVSATDTDNDTLTYTLGGTDASLFSIVSSSGQLQTTAALISGTQSIYSVTVTANDGNGGSASVNVGVTATRSDDISDRTQQVQDAIVAAVPDVTSANDVTETHLAAITELDLWRKGISELKAGDFDGLTALEELYLDSNFSLSSLPDGIFDELTALKTLNLSTIIISSLPSGIFDELTALEKLYLFQTRLTSVPADVFDELTALKELDMGYNRRLTSLPAGVFDNLTALTTLYFSEAERLTSFPDGIFDELTALTYLEIAGSCKSVETLPDNVFNNLTNLTYLDVSSNNLTSWPDGIAGNLTALETLALYNNSLSSWPDDVFDDFTALTTLSLFNNSFGSLPDGIFDELTNLSTLWLGSNGLSSLPDGIFDNNTQLKDLSLGNNKLTTLPDGIFDNNTALTTLSLYKNSLTALSSDIFQNLTNLSTLMLYENKLTTLPDGIFVGLTNLSALSLWGNTTNPIPLRITLVKVEDRKYKAVAPTGAPYHISVLLKFKNGWTEGGVARIRTGHTESQVYTMVRWPGNGPDDDTFHGPLTVDINLENTSSSGIPRGLALAKYGLDQPLEVEGAIGAAPASVENGTPKVSALLPNFPNPFNPETWIPYHLAKASDVQITIYNARGVVVRSLALGRKRAGYYTNRNRAAHWDGRNTFGEKVAAGVYFYQLQADSVSFLRKMVILK